MSSNIDEVDTTFLLSDSTTPRQSGRIFAPINTAKLWFTSNISSISDTSVGKKKDHYFVVVLIYVLKDPSKDYQRRRQKHKQSKLKMLKLIQFSCWIC